VTSSRTRGVRYDGSACLNLRSITDAVETLGGKARGQPMSRQELAGLLWFVEICVTSRRLYFDGTLPPEDVEQAQEVVTGFLHRQKLSDLRIEPIGFKREADILHHATAAIIESSLIIGDLALERDLDRAVRPEEHGAFVRHVNAAAGLTGEARKAQALELVEQRFRGSKCLAGLLGAGPQVLEGVRRLYARHPDRGSLVTGALINRFRLNYLNQLASHKRGAYVPNPNFEPVTQQHVKLFQDYLVKQVAREAVRDGADLLAEAFREETPLPPIGLYALMLTRSSGQPLAVLTTALEKFKGHRALRKLVWGHTRAGLELKARGQALNEYSREVDEYFLSAYRRLKEEAEGIRAVRGVGERIKKYTVPALLTVVAGLAPIPVAAGAAAALAYKVVIGTAAGAAAQALGDRLLGIGMNSYISEYKSLRFALADDPALALPAARIADQVERVFGRTLT
jgi:hypothetical protein